MPRATLPTVGTYFLRLVERFQRSRLHFGHGTQNAIDEAAYLVLHTLKLPLDTPLGGMDRPLKPGELRRLEALAEARMKQRVPAPYLTGEAWLGEFSFHVDRRTIIPRSFIAELLRERLEPWAPRPVRRVLDLCTGSGCLAVLAAHAFPRARVDASELSASALKVAARNVARYGLGRRIRLVRSDLFAALEGLRYDLIVSNPPYVRDASMRTLPAEYLHEPRGALAGGEDGLNLVRRILAQAPRFLSPRGLLVCEIGHNRRALERAYPRIAFLWPEIGAGTGHVFVLERSAMPVRTDVQPARTRATPRATRRAGAPRGR